MTNEKKVQERSINITNLFLYLGKKWRVIIIGVIGIATIFSVIMWFRMRKIEVESNEAIELAEEIELTEEEIAFVEQVRNLADLVECRKDYIDSSILMQLNPFREAMVILEYNVSCDDIQNVAFESKIADIYREKIKIILLNENWKQNFKIEEMDDLNELVKVEDSTGVFDTTIKIKIVYVDIESCKSIADSLKEEMGSLQMQVTDDLGEHQIVLQGETEGIFVDADLANLQREVFDNYNTYKDQLDRSINQMSAEQEKLYWDDEADDEIIMENEIAIENEKASFSIKIIFLGALIGLVLMVGILSMIYIITDKIYFEGELEDILALCSLGVIECGKDQNISVREHLEKTLINNIEALCKRANNFIVYLYADENEYFSLKRIIEKSSETQIELKWLDKDEKKGINCLVEVENVIIMETLNQSHMLKLARFIDLCDRNKVNVFGTVMVFA